MENSSEDNWEEMKEDVAKTYNKTMDNIKDGWEDLKRGVNDGVNKVKDRLD